VTVKIELLYFDDCPSYQRLLPRLKALVDEYAPAAAIELRRVESPVAAQRERFLGSPTVRVDGADVEPAASRRSDFGLKCRLYRVGGRHADVPPEDWTIAALKRAAGDGH
jgi:hypothetical protein